MVVEQTRPVKGSHQPRNSEMLHGKKGDFVIFIAMVRNCTAQAEKKSKNIGMNHCECRRTQEILSVNVWPSQNPDPVYGCI
jgi:hypothetical protein